MPRHTLQDRLNQFSTEHILPFNVLLTHETGEVIHCVESSFDWFVSRMRRWSQHFVIVGQIQHPTGGALQGVGKPLAVNQEKKWLAAQYEYPGAGKATVLPSLVSGKNEDIAAQFLARRFPEEFGATEPKWAETIEIAGMADLTAAIHRLDQEMARLTEQKIELQSKFEELREFRRLVYESGKPLERIVEKAFRQLGGRLVDKRYGDEEFVVQCGNTECIIEVKGVTGSASKAHVHQLLGHLVTASEDGRERKGVLVVNPSRDLPLDKRDTPDRRAFPDNVVKFASSNGIALITGQELLLAIQKQLAGELPGTDAIARIEATSGIVKLS